MRGTKMKLNYKRTIFVGFAFFLICTFWQAYDTIIPKILTDKFGMSQAASGADGTAWRFSERSITKMPAHAGVFCYV